MVIHLVQRLFLEMWDQGVLKPPLGNILSQEFVIPKTDSSTPGLVVDLSCLNHFIEPFKFRLLMITQAQLALCPGAWFISLNLENAYWHILTDPRYRHFLAIQTSRNCSPVHGPPIQPKK